MKKVSPVHLKIGLDKMVNSTKFRWGYHVLFWIFINLDIILGAIGVTNNYHLKSWDVVLLILLKMIVVYFNIYVLAPRVIKTKNELEYIYLSFLSLIIASGLSAVIYLYFLNYDIRYNGYFFDYFLSLFIENSTVLGTAVGIKLLKFLFLNQEKFKELETITLKAEVTFLKEQMNPHFLFNSLNNIYVQTRKDPKKASESVLLLSDLLRYQLYECQKKRVELRQEIDYFKSYMKLHQLRKHNLNLDISIKGSIEKKRIAPFIFQPFVENAIKHGLSVAKDSFLKILFDVDDEKIVFHISNSKVDGPSPKYTQGGIGLPNVKRRLELIYPENHLLIIKNEKEIFIVDLTIYTPNYS